MKIAKLIRRLIFLIIRVPWINAIGRGLFKPFASIFPNIITHIPVAGKVQVHLPNTKILTLVADGCDPIASQVYWNGITGYEPETMKEYLHLLKHCNTVFDIGANTGLYALLAALDNPNRQVHAFEPVPRVFGYLLRNMEINRLDNVVPVCQAVTNCDGVATFYIPSMVSSSCSFAILKELKRMITLPASASLLPNFTTVETEPTLIPTITLDTYIAKNNIDNVDLLKIDTEGTEHLVLEGAKNIVEKYKPVVICEVLPGLTENFLHSILDKTDYQFFLITKDGLVPKLKIVGSEMPEAWNYLFVPASKIEKIL